MMGTVWVRMGTTQEHIQPFINAIVSFAIAISKMCKPSLADLPVLRIGIHELHGCGICTRVSRRQGNIHQRARQWSVWSDAIHAFQFPYWTSVSLYAFHPIPMSTRLTTNKNSHNLHPLLNRSLLALQLPPHGTRLLHLGNVALPRPPRRRIPRRARNLPPPQLRPLPRHRGLRQRPLDERRRVPNAAHPPQPVLEIRVPLHRLPGVCVPGNDD